MKGRLTGNQIKFCEVRNMTVKECRNEYTEVTTSGMFDGLGVLWLVIILVFVVSFVHDLFRKDD